MTRQKLGTTLAEGCVQGQQKKEQVQKQTLLKGKNGE
jgi:hypothetical protein